MRDPWEDVYENAAEHLPMYCGWRCRNYLRRMKTTILNRVKRYYRYRIPTNVGMEDPIFAGAVDYVQREMINELRKAHIKTGSETQRARQFLAWGYNVPLVRRRLRRRRRFLYR